MKNSYNSKNYNQLKGKTITITGNTCSHGYGAPGTKHSVKDVRLYSTMGVHINGNSSYISFCDFTAGPQSIAEIKELITELTSEISLLKNKLLFMEAQGIKEFDETEFTVFNVLQEIKNDTSDIAKARAIAKLINSN